MAGSKPETWSYLAIRIARKPHKRWTTSLCHWCVRDMIETFAQLLTATMLLNVHHVSWWRLRFVWISRKVLLVVALNGRQHEHACLKLRFCMGHIHTRIPGICLCELYTFKLSCMRDVRCKQSRLKLWAAQTTGLPSGLESKCFDIVFITIFAFSFQCRMLDQESLVSISLSTSRAVSNVS